jgi:hypothetical protein
VKQNCWNFWMFIIDYGAIDMIVSPEDEYYFIEINVPENSSGWIILPKKPYFQKYCRYLCDKAPRRNNMVLV